MAVDDATAATRASSTPTSGTKARAAGRSLAGTRVTNCPARRAASHLGWLGRRRPGRLRRWRWVAAMSASARQTAARLGRPTRPPANASGWRPATPPAVPGGSRDGARSSRAGSRAVACPDRGPSQVARELQPSHLGAMIGVRRPGQETRRDQRHVQALGVRGHRIGCPPRGHGQSPPPVDPRDRAAIVAGTDEGRAFGPVEVAVRPGCVGARWRSMRGDEGERIDDRSVLPARRRVVRGAHLEVQMGRGRASRHPHPPQHPAGGDQLARPDGHRARLQVA